MIGRRVSAVSAITQPGDYYLNPLGNASEGPSLWFCLPIDTPGEPGFMHRVTSPPWTFRECPDGSVEVRASIQTYEADGSTPRWHGFLDEGHSWREC